MSQIKLITQFLKEEWFKVQNRNEPFTLKMFERGINKWMKEELRTQRWCSLDSIKKTFHEMNPRIVKSLNGTGSNHWIAADVDFNKTPMSRKMLAVVGGFPVCYDNLIVEIEKIMIALFGDANARLPKGGLEKIQTEILTRDPDISLIHAKAAYVIYRKKFPVRSSGNKPLTTLKAYKRSFEHGMNDIVGALKGTGAGRGHPNQEMKWCKAVSRLLIESGNIPYGGAGLLIGTPVSISVSKNHGSQGCCKGLILDNALVASTLELTTSKDIPPMMVIGNYMRKDQANVKASFWKSIDIFRSWDIRVDLVDEVSFTYYVSHLCHQHSLVKVIIMNGGSFTGKSVAKYGLKADFQKVSRRLVEMFPNLHILAMQRNRIHRGFDIRYVSNKTDKLYPLQKGY